MPDGDELADGIGDALSEGHGVPEHMHRKKSRNALHQGTQVLGIHQMGTHRDQNEWGANLRGTSGTLQCSG